VLRTPQMAVNGVNLMFQAAILIIKIGFLKARRWRAFKKPI
jgi:hypothetical protein